MPIRPENKALYPPNWKSEIVPRIRARSGNRCECTGQCGQSHGGGMEDGWDRCKLYNGLRGWWQANGTFYDNAGVIDSPNGEKVITIVLTVAHLNHKPQDCRDENLLHMCQGCHNRYDMPTRRAGIKARAHAARAIGDLFCEPV